MWQRAVTVQITSDDRKTNVVYGYQRDRRGTTHCIDFEYKSSIGWGSDYGTITIYNLAPEEQSTFLRKEVVLNVTLYAGYKDLDTHTSGVPVVFVGSITNVVTYKSGTENITQLYCVPTASLSVTRLCNLDPIPKGSSLKAALALLTKGCSLGVKYTGVPDFILSRPFKRGRAFSKTFRDELKSLCEENNLSFNLAGSFVEFFPALMTNDSIARMMQETGVIKISPINVVGTGVSGITTLELSLTLNASIMPGMLIDVTGLQPKVDRNHPEYTKPGFLAFNQQYEGQLNTVPLTVESNGIYQIKDMVHHGSTHGDAFQSDLLAVMSPDSLIGSKDSDWREWGTRVTDPIGF